MEIRVLHETLALALHGETLIIGRRRSLAKNRISPSIQGGGPSAVRKNSSVTSSNPSTTRKQALAHKEGIKILSSKKLSIYFQFLSISLLFIQAR